MDNGAGLSIDQIVAFMEHAPANIFFKDTSCRYRMVSEACSLINDGDCDIIGKTDAEVWADEALGRRYYEDDLCIIATGESSRWVDEFPGPEGTLYYEINKRPAYLDGELIGIVGIVTNVTDQKRAEAELERLMAIDQLTGLMSRNYLEVQARRGYSSESCPIALIVMDCNNLKRTNDEMGHEAGDELLVRVAAVIRQSAPHGAVAARLGGDEFLIASPRTDEAGAQRLMDGLREAFRRASDDACVLDVAMGHAIADDDASATEAFQAADAAMYADKRRSRAARSA